MNEQIIDFDEIIANRFPDYPEFLDDYEIAALKRCMTEAINRAKEEWQKTHVEGGEKPISEIEWLDESAPPSPTQEQIDKEMVELIEWLESYTRMDVQCGWVYKGKVYDPQSILEQFRQSKQSKP